MAEKQMMVHPARYPTALMVFAVCGAMMFSSQSSAAATRSGSESMLGGASDDLPIVELKPVPDTPSRRLTRAGSPLSGNPLWQVPLSALTATRDRPIFSPSRRPLAPAVVGVPVAAAPSAPAPLVAERLSLALIGTISNGTEGIALLMEPATQQIIQLRLGETHAGWVLRSVQSREARLEKGAQTEILALPKPSMVSATPYVGFPPASEPPPRPGSQSEL